MPVSARVLSVKEDITNGVESVGTRNRILSARYSSLLSVPLHNTRAETLRRIAENPPAYACVIDGPQMGPPFGDQDPVARQSDTR